jgi:hypothetical protein
VCLRIHSQHLWEQPPQLDIVEDLAVYESVESELLRQILTRPMDLAANARITITKQLDRVTERPLTAI